MSFLDHGSDFITLAEGQDRGWLDGTVEVVVAWCASGSMLQVGSNIVLLSMRRLPAYSTL